MTTDHDSVSILRVVLAFAVVFGLMGVLAFGLRMLSERGFKLPGRTIGERRLKVVETLPLDVRRRLVIVRWDGDEHLILLSPESETVVSHKSAKDPV
jgi:flagellar protein FliO/FliZ